MIHVFLLDHYRETIDVYLETWARRLKPHLRSISYESLVPGATFEGSTFIFGDLERLTDAQCRRAAGFCETITAAGGCVLNPPGKVLRRHALLRKLHETAANPFNVYRERELTSDVHYPVFVRRERAHNGALTSLLQNRRELQKAIAHLKQSRRDTADLLIVEYLDTACANDGLFRKYSAMRIGDRLIPRHILFSTDWVDKTPDVITDESTREEAEFLRSFPHASQLRSIFDIAGIDFGRIDYSLLNGKIVTWEINTNPTVLPMPEKCDSKRIPGQVESARLINDALLELDKKPSTTVRLKRFDRVLVRTDISWGNQGVIQLARLMAMLQKHRYGKRMFDVISRIIRIARDQNPSYRR